MTGLLGVTAVSEDIRVTGSHIRQILAEFSFVGGEGPPIDFRTDAAPDVTALIQRSGIPREYTVTRAGPQNHDSVGSVERGVREVKGQWLQLKFSASAQTTSKEQHKKAGCSSREWW